MNPTSFKWIKLRIVSLSGFFVLFLIIILFRSYQLHVLGNARVHRLANRQYNATLPIQPKRGTIYDRNGDPLALDVQVASIALHPQKIEKADLVIQSLSSLLEMPKDKIEAAIKSEKKFIWLARRIESESGDKIQALKLKGVSVFTEYKRYYPNKELAGNVLGAVGFDAKALAGIELSLDQYLRSQGSSMVAQRDAKGRLYTTETNEENYNDVYLTIDKNIQFIAEKYLWENAEKYKVKHGFAIVLDPKTGELLAMANYPSFNPNTYSKYALEDWKNHAVVSSYEPGSTFKGILAAAALQTRRVGPEDSFFCENGVYKIGNRTIHDHEGYGNLTFTEIIGVSSNIGITKIANKIGRNAYYEMLNKLGFGSRIGINVPGEDSGRLLDVNHWTDIDFSNISFGQGIAVNGLQMARAYAAFANDGLVMKPYLVSKIISIGNQTIVENKPTSLERVLTAEKAHQLTKMLETVVLEGGTGKMASLDGYQVAGKTGTAQKVNSQTKSYDHENFVSSFIGYVPSNKPEFVIYVVYDSPKPVYYGGTVAAPIFKKIAEDALSYRGVAPSKLKLAQKSAQEQHD